MTSDRRLDDAARAAWLAHIGGRKQDEIAEIMGISRQSAQRLVSQAAAAGLVKVHIDHPIARCMELSGQMRDRFGLTLCEVVPSLNSPDASRTAVSTATGDMIERWLRREAPQIIGLGTGRTLRGAIEHLPQITCDHHRIVSLTGNIAPDGSTAYYNVLFTMADKVTAPTFPMPLPVIAATRQERDALLAQKTLAPAVDLARRTDVRFVGLGAISGSAPLLEDGFITEDDQARLIAKGAVAEIIGFVFDAAGQLIDDDVNARVSSTSLVQPLGGPTIASANGTEKVAGIRAAMRGGLVDALITDERTAEALLD